MKIAQADAQLCGKRLTGRLVVGGEPGQEPLPGIDFPELEGVFDCKSVGFNRKRISAGLTFALEGLDKDTLCGFAKRVGKLVIEATISLDEEED